nr:PREDICTED: probable G-protein coupled receptor 156 isoform X1 [Lepisosteus oculatus]XP_015219191.1 PREDICTED: probable G-protein coupled receptor 156 isoform X1 [Lepisosteus oculatus]
MDPALNCSDVCDSRDCSIGPDIDPQEGWEVLNRLCGITARSSFPETTISPVLCAVMWTLLSGGILLSAFFLVFTIRFKSNRIVKMSSPNLNVLTLFGSVLTYSSGVLFGIEEKTLLSGAAVKTLLQARVWTLCIGSSLVFGPILTKTWRLYKVFTQRVPDKRVIIKDIQLMGLVTGLMLVDILVLTVWGLMDPVQCVRSISGVVKMAEKNVIYSLSQTELCSSLHADVWIILISVLKGSLLLYGTYLAGLTSNVSSPPVNQSLTIMAGVFLITVSAGATILITRLFHSWPNLIYSFTSGGIFLCTVTIDCLVFVPQLSPQLTQWKQFEDDLTQTPAQMAKYFSSPSRSFRSLYSEEEIYYLLGENSSMKRLLTEKNAVIESLQEQVNNAKEKLVRLMSANSASEASELNSTNKMNSASAEMINVRLEDSGPGVEHMGVITEQLPVDKDDILDGKRDSTEKTIVSDSVNRIDCPLNNDCEVKHERQSPTSSCVLEMEEQYQAVQLANNMTENESQTPCDLNPVQLVQSSTKAIEAPSFLKDQSSVNKHNYVSSEKLQEILQDLSIDAVSSLRSPSRVRKVSDPVCDESPSRTQFQHCFPGISPYIMRKRRPPFHNSRGGPPPYYFPGSEPPCARTLVSSDLHRNDSKIDNRKDSLPPQTPAVQNVHHPLPTGEEEEEPTSCSSKLLPPREAKRSLRDDYCDLSIEPGCSRKCAIAPFSALHSKPLPSERQDFCGDWQQYDYSDSDSSSSEESYCFYHRPYCDACFRGPYESSESNTSETSESEYGGLPHPLRRTSHLVVNFKEDLKPTFV